MTRYEAISQSVDRLALTEENYQKFLCLQKWHTRRIMNPQPFCGDVPGYCPVWGQGKITAPDHEHCGKFCVHARFDQIDKYVPAPMQPGKIYYVPEPVVIRKIEQMPGGSTWAVVLYQWGMGEDQIQLCDDDIERIYERKRGVHAPTTARFMLKSFAQEFARIESVKVERIQDISRGDCMAEGCPFPNMNAKHHKTDPVGWFRDLWNSIHGPDAWDRNDWVWAYEFERLEVR